MSVGLHDDVDTDDVVVIHFGAVEFTKTKNVQIKL